MLARTFFITVGGLLSGLSVSAQAGVAVPHGVGVRMTIAGLTFVDARGMTLYQRDPADPCTDRPETERPFEYVVWNAAKEITMRVPDAASRRSCAEKYPPFLAAADASPTDRWTLHLRANGSRQWAYSGKPLHTSIKDKVPGQTNAWDTRQWQLAVAPLEAPAGIETRLTSAGLALSNHEGKPLYYPAAGASAARKGPWTPVLVPVAATTEKLPADWSIAQLDGGLRQWAWKGRALYTYAHDAGDKLPPDRNARLFVDIFGDSYGKPLPGWRVALVKPASAPPAGVSVASTSHISISSFRSPKIYADARGKTLYVVKCSEATKDHLDCDDVGDSPRYWLSFCGGEERCMKTWTPLTAPRDARPIDGLWSVALMNPRHPYKPLPAGDAGVAVWTYAGRFVFTHVDDEKPGELRGATVPGRQMVSAYPTPAFVSLPSS